MANTVFTVDTGTNECSLKELVPYPNVASSAGSITVTESVDGTGKKTYNVEVTHDVNMDVVSFNPSTLMLVMTETDGDTFSVDLKSLISTVTETVAGHKIAKHESGDGTVVLINETVTSLAGSGSDLVFINEAGGTTNIPICSLVANVAVSATKIGG